MERRAQIVQAAFELFAERGFRGASLGQVAARVGLTNAGVLHHFASKEELLISVLAERDREDEAAVEQALPRDGSLHTALERSRAVVAHNVGQPGLVQAFTVLAAESVTEDHPAQQFFRERYARFRARIAADLERDGHLATQETVLAATLMLAVMDGLQVQWLLAPDEVDMEATFTLFERMLEDGLLQPRPSTP
ncbi:TetR family transcriptional regulator [Motilibacter rhizosphaerae]|uniref:TetR family transcriptional regulator n=1 Tax=Motilibacter rhizosphaerae TaxID=598652 RepID=A0A4Q7NWK9_9ACTN|nr:TetR/AcrR family transcriptional regulator [Motilibacter rhizosphaerae]RZS91574.1 TetR family transcriptional regulator [Motilibacter rhizosphaerae]